MIKFFRKMLGLPAADIDHLLKAGATVLDVRTPTEFKRGHIPGAVNVHHRAVGREIRTIKKLHQPIVTCCRRGWRSDIAAKALRELGLEVYHGGSCNKLAERLERIKCKAVPCRQEGSEVTA